MYLISISGKINTGKNTLSALLEQELYAEYMRDIYANPSGFIAKFMAFADPIKEIVMTMFPQADKKCLYGPSYLRDNIIPNAFKSGKPLSYRQALLDIGTKGRSYNEYVWVDNFDYRFKNVNSFQPNLIVATDCRFREEFDYLKKEGFFQIRLYRDTNSTPIDHVSETNQNYILDREFDYILINNSSIDKLQEEIRNNIIPKLK